MARRQFDGPRPWGPPGWHTVEAGDTLWDIAQVYYGDGNQWHKIAAANGNPSPETLQIGQKLAIPPPVGPDTRGG